MFSITNKLFRVFTVFYTVSERETINIPFLEKRNEAERMIDMTTQ